MIATSTSTTGSPRLWTPTLGATCDDAGVCFRVWAPFRTRVELVLDPYGPAPRHEWMIRAGDGTFTGTFDDVAAGDP